MNKRSKRWLSGAVAGGALAAGAFAFVPMVAQAEGGADDGVRQANFAAAAEEFHVPVSVLLAVADQESHWQPHKGYNSNGGYGLMNLTDVTTAMVGGGESGAAGHSGLTSLTDHPELHTLPTAAKLAGESADAVRHEERANIRAGAALLSSYQKKLTGGTSTDPQDWAGAVGMYSHLSDAKAAGAFVHDVYGVIRKGTHRTTPDGQKVGIDASASVDPASGQLAKLKLKTSSDTQAECPATLDCTFVPAAPSNGQVSDRPANGIEINQIVIHTTEGSYDAAIKTFQTPGGSSAQYVMRASDGAVTQMVPNKDVAFGDGNYWSNLHSIQIEHEGFSARGADWYTPAAYEQTAKLVRYLAARYHIPLDRQHILGHDNVPAPSDSLLAAQHWDPGYAWNWAEFMRMLGAPTDSGPHGVGPAGSAVTISPGFEENRQTYTVCPADDPSGATKECGPLTAPSNSLFVRSAPSADAPLLRDPVVHPDADSGTDGVSDWSDTVQDGQHFVVAEVRGDWTAIWYDGQKGWIFNPGGKNTIPAKGVRIIRATGDSAPVYGTAYPDAAEYPEGLSPSTQAPLTAENYAIPAGQAYVADAAPVAGDDFFPTGGQVVKGAKRYYTVQFNRRYVMVDSADVTATPARGY